MTRTGECFVSYDGQTFHSYLPTDYRLMVSYHLDHEPDQSPNHDCECLRVDDENGQRCFIRPLSPERRKQKRLERERLAISNLKAAVSPSFSNPDEVLF